MRGIVKFGSIIAVSLIFAGGLIGCGTLTPDAAPTDDEIVLGQEGRTLWETRLQYIKIVDRDKPGIANEHPEAISSEQLRTVLSSLYVSEKSIFGEKQLPVFSPAELQVLSAAVPMVCLRLDQMKILLLSQSDNIKVQ